MPYFITTLFCLIISFQDATSEALYNPFENHSDKINDNIKFHLYTRRNTATSFILEPENKNGFRNSPLNPSHHTVIYIHGFAEDQSSESAQGIKNAYLEKGEFNIILVSWSKLATAPWYINAVKNLPTVGAYIAKLIKWLEYKGVNYSSNLHVIGFSLGAHVAAFVGEELARNRFSKIRRITGLDPAGPAFESITTMSKRLNKEDAIFVDIIHTNTRGLGIGNAIGHADFYVNYGKSQPGCGILDVGCSHGRSWELYVESISNPFGFPASICATWKPTVNQCTLTRNVFMGSAVNQQSRGVFYVETQSRFPFAKNTIPSSKNPPANRKPVQQGGHALYSHVDKLPIELDERSVYYT